MPIKRIARKLKTTYQKIIASSIRYCPVCESKLNEKFTPLHPKYLEQQQKHGFPYNFDDGETLNFLEFKCPSCSATDRDRLFAMYIKKSLKNDLSYKLLDIAPSPALQIFLKKNNKIKYRSADLMMEGVDDHVDLEDMGIYADNSFDIFICSHVLEHVRHDLTAMKELRRILKPGGWGIAMVPIALKLKVIDEDIHITDTAERWKRFGQDDHVRLYSKNGFVERLEKAGFKVKQFGIKYFGKKNFERCGIEAKSVLYIVSK
jgi:SAM-dependent methyltransferase